MDERADKSLEVLRKKAEALGVECRPESFRGSSVQAAIARGGRYLAEAFESAWKVDRYFASLLTPIFGALVTSSGKLNVLYAIHFQEGGGIGPLKRALKTRKWLLELILEDFSPEDPLPWSHLNAGLPPKTLQKHALEAMSQVRPPLVLPFPFVSTI